MYSISELSKISGVTTRTLRYYESIGLLNAHRDSSSGYRLYDLKQVDRLQHILILRTLDVPVKKIQEILDRNEDEISLLQSHLDNLKSEEAKLLRLIESVEKTIDYKTRGEIMKDKEKFEAFKAGKISDNEKQYGKEVREKYGNQTVDESNQKFMGLSAEDYMNVEKLSEDIKTLIINGVVSGDNDGSFAKDLVEKHKTWLCYFWKEYSAEVHRGLAEMYLADERFKAHYDAFINGGTEFLVSAIRKYC